MNVLLPVSGSAVVLRDFVPHKVVLAYNDAMYKGVQIKSSAVSATKEELGQEFGLTTLQELEELPPGPYEKKLAELREEYLRRQMDVEGLTLGNVQEANVRKVAGMVVQIGGVAATREAVEDLPTEDVEFLLERIEEISDAARQKKASAQHGS